MVGHRQGLCTRQRLHQAVQRARGRVGAPEQAAMAPGVDHVAVIEVRLEVGVVVRVFVSGEKGEFARFCKALCQGEMDPPFQPCQAKIRVEIVVDDRHGIQVRDIAPKADQLLRFTFGVRAENRMRVGVRPEELVWLPVNRGRVTGLRPGCRFVGLPGRPRLGHERELCPCIWIDLGQTADRTGCLA